MRRWIVVGPFSVVLLLAACFATYGLSRSRTYQLTGDLVSRVATAEKVVALTFDDGPGDSTPEILDMLAAAGVSATFYLNGADVDRHPEYGAAIARAGHEIGNHTYTHRRMMFVAPGTGHRAPGTGHRAPSRGKSRQPTPRSRELGTEVPSRSGLRMARNYGPCPTIWRNVSAPP